MSIRNEFKLAGTRSPWMTLIAVAVGQFLSVLSTTVVSVALPGIGTDLQLTTPQMEWVVDAYVIMYASLLAAGGALSDRFGPKRFYLLGVTVFGLGALLAGVAPSISILLIARAIQGIGPALLVPASLAVLRRSFTDPRRRAVALGLWSTSSGLGLATGPIIGGLLTATLGWRWIFLMNAPLVVALVVLGARVVSADPDRKRTSERFDWFGTLLATVGIASLTFSIIQAQAGGIGLPVALGVLAVSGAAIVAFVQWERRAPAPLMDVSLFVRPWFAAANIAAFVVFFVFTGLILYSSTYFQSIRGETALQAGFSVSAIGIAFAVAAAISGRLVARFGERWPLIVGLLLAATGVLSLLPLSAGSSDASWWAFSILGLGIGLCGTPMTTIAISSVDASRAGSVSAILNTTRQIGQVFGVALLGAVVYAGLPTRSERRLDPQLFIEGLHHALWLCGLALIATALCTGLLLSHKARHPPVSQSAES